MIVIARNQVFLAADSVVTIPGHESTKACKIHQAGSIFWAGTGISNDSITGFTTEKFITPVAKKGMSLQRTLDVIGVQLVPALQRELPRLKEMSPRIYENSVKHRHMATLYAVRTSGRVFRAYAKEFDIIDGVIVAEPAVTLPPVGKEKFAIRYNTMTEITAYIVSHPDLLSWEPTTAIDAFMDVGQKADPAKIGPPFSILMLDAKGAHWVKQGLCPPIKRQ